MRQGIPIHCHDLLKHNEYGAPLGTRVIHGLQHHRHEGLVEGRLQDSLLVCLNFQPQGAKLLVPEIKRILIILIATCMSLLLLLLFWFVMLQSVPCLIALTELELSKINLNLKQINQQYTCIYMKHVN